MMPAVWTAASYKYFQQIPIKLLSDELATVEDLIGEEKEGNQEGGWSEVNEIFNSFLFIKKRKRSMTDHYTRPSHGL